MIMHRFSFGFASASVVVVLLSSLLLLTSACSDKKSAQAGPPQAMPVQVKTAQPAKVNESTEYVATLKSRETAVIMPQVDGIITQIFVHSGQHVAEGVPLIQIDPSKQQATVKSQEDARADILWGQTPFLRLGGSV